MIQSPRGYPLLRDDPKTSLAEEPVTSSLWYDEVGNDIAWGLDARGQVKGAWAATSATVLTAGDNEFGANGEGLGVAYRIETIGPFPLNRLPDGRPEVLRCVVDLKSSDGEEVFCRAVLRPHAMSPAAWPTTPAVRDGWNHGFCSTDATSYSALPVQWQASAVEATNPMRGFLQLPPPLWGYTFPVDAGDRDTIVACCVDLWLGRMADTTTVTLGGYTLYAVSYGERDTAGP